MMATQIRRTSGRRTALIPLVLAAAMMFSIAQPATAGSSGADDEYGILHNSSRGEVIVTGKQYASLNQGTAIRVFGNERYPWTWILRINLVIHDNFGLGVVHLSKDFPILNPDGSSNVESITYEGGEYENQFSNYTALPLHATGGSTGDDFFLGGSGDDVLDGGGFDDKLVGGDGDDTLIGGGGHDTMLGDAGDDDLDGGAGDDHLDGGDDNDVLDGGSGDDDLRGRDGTDSLFPGTGDDLSYGGSGADTIEEFAVGPDSYNYGPDVNLLCGQEGSDILKGSPVVGTVNHLDGEPGTAGSGVSDGSVDVLHGYGINDTYDFDPLDTFIFYNDNLVLVGDPDYPSSTPTSC